jgi:eukaryotic-like serine/threonine-protein kinase
MDVLDEEAELAAQRLGQTVGGRWHLSRVLGVGGMAAVYAAHDDSGRLAAVKILHPEMSVRREVKERFLREGYVANRIEHPGAVKALEHGDAGEEAFLVMELLNGETLHERVKRHGKLPPAEVLDFTDQILDVLVSAHEKGVVHRDLKPDNLFVTAEGPIKILDFGLARLLDGMPNDHKTKSGVALGTLPYMAPEQALGRRSEIDGRVDVFAVGATMFRILSGRRIHVADSEAELLMAMASRPAPALSSVAPELQRDLCAVVDLALAFSREARYPDARTMQTDVRALRQGAPPPFARARLAARDQATRVDVAAPSPERVPQRTQPLEAMPMSRGATMPLHAFQGTLPGGAPPPNALIHTGAEDIPASNRAPHSSRTEKLAVHKPADVGSPTSAPATAVGYGVSSPAQGERPRRSLLLVALVGVFFLMIGAAAAFVFLREDAGGDAALEANAPLPAPEADPVAAAAPGPTTARADAVAAAKVAEAAPKKGTDVTAGKANADDPAKPGVPAETAAKDTTAAPDATPIASAASAAPAAAKAAEAAPAETGTNLLAPPPAPTTKPPPPPKGKSKRKKDH